MNTETTKEVQTLKAHLAVNVRNVEQSIEFYKKMFGIEPSKIRTGYAKFDVQNPPLNFTLNERNFSERGALSHLGIQVASTEDMLAMRENWERVGLVTRDEMQTNCCYATQDKTWTRDPDGNEWEVFVVLEDNLPKTAETLQAADCCAPKSATQENIIETDASCGCETAPPTRGEAACCETQAVKFGMATETQSSATCCAPQLVEIS
ncbi:MAG: VOC family protein [Acidobacteriota bacterium]|nr:VOC family protein [Acidobacteriota bacterium]